MNNAKIAHQLETAHRAIEQLTGAGVTVRRVQLGQSRGQPAIVCVAAHPADYVMEWCEGAQLLWTSPDESGAEEIGPRDQLPSHGLAPTDMAALDGGACRHCGCTDLNACENDDGTPCWWIAPGLCSACAESIGVDIEAHRKLGAEADVGHALAGLEPKEANR